jgi:predicted DsbA family dithiol-disulfide isomerase
MFKAYFEDLEDIGNVEAVVKVGASVGLNASDLRTALQDGIYREQVDAGIEWSRGIGVTAVPTFIFNERFAMVGAHELPAFRDAMAQAGQPPKA